MNPANDRKGIIGFMLTLALGVAVGAATLVVGNEVVKGIKDPQKKPTDPVIASATSKISTGSNSKAATAAKRYTTAQQDYYRSIMNQSGDAKAKSKAVAEANLRYQQEKQQIALNKSEPAKTTSPGLKISSPFEEGTTTTVTPAVPRTVESGNAVATALTTGSEAGLVY